MKRIVFAALATIASPAMSQTSGGDLSAAQALSASHIGALSPLITPAMVSRRLNGAQFAVRYAIHDLNTPSHALAASAIFGMGLQSSVTVTAGFRTTNNCSSCSAQLFLGAGGDMRIGQLPDFIGTGNQLNIAVGGDLGYARMEPTTDAGVALGVSLPITWVIRSMTSGMRIAPFFTPSFGIGQADVPCTLLSGPSLTDCGNNGTRWLLGGGVGLWNPESQIAVTLGAQHLKVPNGRTVYGLNVIIGGAR